LIPFSSVQITNKTRSPKAAKSKTKSPLWKTTKLVEASCYANLQVTETMESVGRNCSDAGFCQRQQLKMLERMKKSARQFAVHSGVRLVHMQRLQPVSPAQNIAATQTPIEHYTGD